MKKFLLPSSTATSHVPLPGYWLFSFKDHGIRIPIPKHAVFVNLILSFLVLGMATLALGLGEVKLSPLQVWQALLGTGDPLHLLVVKELRLMRVLAGISTGAAFAVAGCLMQTLASNRLATPGIIGIDNAATAFAVASVVGLSTSFTPPVMSITGAIVATTLIFALAGGSGTQGYRFIVVGLGIGAIAGAITQLMLSMVAIDSANAAFPWTVGSLNARSKEATYLLSFALILALLAAFKLSKGLQLLQLSESVCVSLGVNLKQIRVFSLLLSVLLTGLAVAVAGPVGLVALLGPEIARLLCRHKGIPILASALTGALLMLSADLVGRLILSPLEIPVGIITAIVGSPYLLWMLLNPSFKNRL